MDRYTKVVLTLIAFALWANLFAGLAPAGHGLIRDANAQPITRVVIAGVEMGALPVAIAAGQAAPVYLTAGPNLGNPLVLAVNVAQIGSRSFQQGVALPVDIEGISGAPVKSSGGLPVALASTQPLVVTAKDPLPVTARDALPVIAKDPLNVVVTKLPVSAAVANRSPASSGTATQSSTTSSGTGGPGGY